MTGACEPTPGANARRGAVLQPGAGTRLHWAAQAARLPRLGLGLVIFGLGVSAGIIGDLGLPPWDLLHQGLADKTPLSFGMASILVGGLLLAIVVSLGERIGVGTVANVVAIGIVIDVSLAVLETPESTAARVAYMVAGPVLIGLGSSFYLGARLGAGARDGLMSAFAARGVKVWHARTAVEGMAFAGGLALGVRPGVGTIVFLLAVGPCVQLFLRLGAAPVHPDEVIAATG